MKKSVEQSRKSHTAAHQATSDGRTSLNGHNRERFPNAEELITLLGDEVSTAVDTELAVMAYERHLIRIARQATQTPLTAFSRSGLLPLPSHIPDAFRTVASLDLLPAPSHVPLAVLPQALRYPRVDHRTLKPSERNRFNRALQQAYQAGAYQQLAAVHANPAAHRMHSTQGRVGMQRFLPWHRLYLLECERILKTYEPLVRIPYWDYARDRARPDWVWQPPNVNRGTVGVIGSLPSQQTINTILQNNTYTRFTLELEVGAHNEVHNWCNGTITTPATAAYDPIFWLLHANVDRIWNLWQATNNGVPLLNGNDAVLDPWGPMTATDVDSVIDLGYWYSGVGLALGPITAVGG